MTEHDMMFSGIGIIDGSPLMRQQVLSGHVASDSAYLVVRFDRLMRSLTNRAKACSCAVTEGSYSPMRRATKVLTFLLLWT